VPVRHTWQVGGSHVVAVKAKDRLGAVGDWSPGRPVLIADVMATVDVKPDALDPKSPGRWVTGYIELPEGYDVADIDVPSIQLNQSVPPGPWPYAIGDYDHDGVADLMVKFDRQQVLAILPPGDAVEVLITGQVGAETFAGTDTVRVLSKLAFEVESPDQTAPLPSSAAATGLE
jgi:hypothetical protein